MGRKRHHRAEKFLRLPFGKYKGVPLASVPHDYLRWVLREVKLLDRDLERDIQVVLYEPKLNQHRQPQRPQQSVTGTSKPQNTNWWGNLPWANNEPGSEGEIEANLNESDIPF